MVRKAASVEEAPAKTRRGRGEVVVVNEEPVKKRRSAAAEAKVVLDSAFNPLNSIDEDLDLIEKSYGLTGSSLGAGEDRQHTGLLELDLILGRGLQPGWYTFFGPEQSCKSTGATTWMVAALNSSVPIIQYWDYEGSSSPEYIENIMEVAGISIPIEQIFGVRDPKSQQWVVKPRVRYYSEGVGEKFFDSLARLERLLPDKLRMNDKWYYVYEGTKENRKKVGDKYDANYFRKTGKFRVEAPDGTLQALLIVDSYPAMLPEKQDVDDPGSSMAVQARMFSDQMKRVKGKMKAKRIAVVGVNQLRKAPMVMFGCFHGSSKIVMADGTQRAIRDIVREKSKDKVLSFNTRTGKVEARKVVGWFENGTTDSWLQFKCNGVNTGNGLSQFRCTPNHLLLGADGVMRPAGEYTVGQQLMANSYQPALSKDQQQLVLGSIIGDGYFLGKGGERFGISHNEHQVDYLRWKEEVFEQHAGTFYEGSGYTKSNGVHVGMHHLEVKHIKDPWFNEQFKEHREGITGQGYRLGTLAEKLDLLGVAVWVMDDGSKNSAKSWFVKTCSLSVKERNHMVRVLNKRLGLGLRGGNIGEDIGVVITTEAMSKLVPYMHPQFGDILKRAYPHISFRKLGTYKVAKVDPGTYGAPVTITSISQTSNMTGKDTEGRSIHDKVKYDIEVEGCHTYCVNGVFVHNSPEYEPGGEALKFFCFSNDTLVQSDKGLLSAEEYNSLYARKGASPALLGEAGLEIPTVFKNMGLSKIVEVSTEFGYTVKGKPGHKVRAVKGGKPTLLWTPLSDIRTMSNNEVYLPVKVGASLFSETYKSVNNEYVSGNSSNNEVNTLKQMYQLDEDFAELLGLLVSEGYVRNGHVIFTNKSELLLDRYKDLLHKVFDLDGKKNLMEVRIYSKHLCQMLEVMGAGGTLSRHKQVPRLVRMSPESVQQAFLKGLFYGDGWTSKNFRESGLMSTSNVLLEQVQLMLLNMGIIAHRRKYVERYTDHHMELASEIARTKAGAVLDTIECRDRYKELYNFGRLYVSGKNASLLQEYVLDRDTVEPNEKNSMFGVLPELLNHKSKGKFASFVSSLKGNRKYYRMGDFYEEWFEDGLDQANRLRTSHEREAFINDLTRLKEFIDYTKNNSLVWMKVSEVTSTKERVTYDCNMPQTHTVVTNGIVSHNSDVRLRMTPRVMNAAPGITGKGMILEEKAVGGGVDKYRFIHVRAHKNKLSVPYLEGWLRLWISDNEGAARGFDPVWDTWRYLVNTGQCSGKMNAIKLALPKHETKKAITWLDFKTMVLGDRKSVIEVCKSVGIKPFDIRAYCTRQLQDKDGLELYFGRKQLAAKEVAEEASVEIKHDGSDED